MHEKHQRHADKVQLSLPACTLSAISVPARTVRFAYVELQLVHKVTTVMTEDGSFVHVFCFMLPHHDSKRSQDTS